MNFGKSLFLVLVSCVAFNGFAAMEFKEADITTVKNIVERNEGAGAVPAKVNDKVGEKSLVSTAAASMAELTFADSSITRMGANTQFSFQSKERLVKLDQGTILIHTPPGNGGATVDCGGVTAAVSGTTFMASQDTAGNVMFVLLEGQGGLKVTAGGSTTVIRPGQAASVGAEVKKEIVNAESSGTPGGEKKALPSGATPAASGDEKGGPGTSPAAPSGGDTGGGNPPSSATPKIQVFEVDVKKVITTTPLIVEFKSELPSAAKIEKTVEVQQNAVKAGKLEKTDTEIVLIKHEDGDVMVGSPKVNPEESVVVNRKTDQAGAGGLGSEKLDVETAAGPGAGAGGTPVATAAAPRVETPAPPPVANTPPPVNPGQTVVVVPPAPVKVAVTARVNDASRPFNQENPNFGFSLTSGSLLAGHSLVSEFLTSATRTSGVAGSPYAVNFSNARVVDGSGTDVSSRYDLTTVAGVLNVLKASPNLVLGPLGSLVFGQSADLVASALTGSPSIEVVSGPASIVNGKLVANSGSGSVVIRASTPGNENYNPAAVEQTITLAKAGQEVSFGPVGAVTFGQSANLVAGTLGGSVSFEVVSGPGTIDSNGRLVATSGTGSVVVRAVTTGNDNYKGAASEQTITLARAAQNINFKATSQLTFGSPELLDAFSLGGGDVSYEIVSGPATLFPLDFLNDPSLQGKYGIMPSSGSGQVVVRAVTTGDNNYDVASAIQTITLAKAGQSVSFTPLPSTLTYNTGTGLTASALDSGTVSFQVISGPGTIDSNGRLVATSGTGSVVVRAVAAGDQNYNGAFAIQTITLAKAGQSVSFTLPANLTFDTATSLAATPTGAGSVTYELVNAADSSKVSITGGQLKALSGTGTVQVRAVTAGDNNYDVASAIQTITLAKAGQSVSFTLPTNLTFDQSTSLGAMPTGAGSVTYELVNPADSSKVSITGGQLKALSGTGTVQVRAVTAGDNNYDVASAIQTITLAKAGQSVSFTLPTTPLTYNTGTGLTASALDSGTVSFQVISGPGTIDSNGRLVATSGTGSVVVRATASGDQNYNGAFVDQTILLQKAQQNLTHSPVSDQLTGSTGSIPINGVLVGTPTFGILETDGRATVDSAGNITIGKILGANDFTFRVNAAGDNNYLVAQKDVTVGISRDVPGVETANPVRQLLILPTAADLAAFDEFFYFTGKTATHTGGPSRFFAEAGVGDTDRTLAAPGSSIEVRSTQPWDFFAARQLTALPGSTPVAISPSAGKTETVFYADQIDLGSSDPRWQGTVDPRTASTSLGYRYLTLNSDYLPVFDKTIAGSEPTGYLDSFGALLSPLENFPVWDVAGGSISVADKVQVDLSGSGWTLVAGSGGLKARGLEVNANGAGVQMMSSGDLSLKTTQIRDVGLGLGSGENLVLEAGGKVKLGTDANLNLDLPTNAGLPEQQQVRLAAQTDTSGNPLAGSLAVIRSGDSLELRNVTIRGFSEARLEKRNPTTKALEGRVLISGSAVRDFKIKELVGAAINADAKIQMMALDQNGALAGDMVVGGDDPVNRNRLPVEAMIAAALKEAGETLPAATAGAMVDAKQIDLAAGNLKFQNANLVAMNAITARANTILIQNSFMTVVRNQGMINMYVSSGLVNQTYGTEVAGRVNFAGINKFTIGNTIIPIGSQSDLTAAYGTNLIDFSQNGGVPQAGKVNVLKL